MAGFTHAAEHSFCPGWAAAQAVTAPRFTTDHFVSSFTQVPPKLGSLNIYAAVGEDVLAELRARGHQVNVAKPPVATPVLFRIDPGSGRIDAAGDPKARRHAAAF
jgi:gamma-glutamyltranspeptidase/glutathione hydrolase